jgi:hypothetical protein
VVQLGSVAMLIAGLVLGSERSEDEESSAGLHLEVQPLASDTFGGLRLVGTF